MKQIYEAPTLTRREKLNTIVAAPPVSGKTS